MLKENILKIKYPNTIWRPKGKALSTTGHRPDKLGVGNTTNEKYLSFENKYRDIFKAQLMPLLEKAYEAGYRTFIDGRAIGWDQLFAECVVEMRDSHGYSDIEIVGALPCIGQDSRWSYDARALWKRLNDSSDHVEVVNKKPWDNINGRMYMTRRNNWLSDFSDGYIRCWNHTAGGTGNFVKYAEENNFPLFAEINPYHVLK